MDKESIHYVRYKDIYREKLIIYLYILLQIVLFTLFIKFYMRIIM